MDKQTTNYERFCVDISSRVPVSNSLGNFFNTNITKSNLLGAKNNLIRWDSDIFEDYVYEVSYNPASKLPCLESRQTRSVNENPRDLVHNERQGYNQVVGCQIVASLCTPFCFHVSAKMFEQRVRIEFRIKFDKSATEAA